MVRREIKNFEMVIDDQKYPCQVPCSVHSVLTKAGADVNSVGDTVRFNAEIYVDDVALAMKNMYIRLRGIRVPARVYFADRLVAKTDGKRPIYNIDIAGLSEKGNNLLSICFDSEDCNLIYAGLSMSVEILRFSSAIIDKVNLVQKHEEGGVTLGIDLNLIGNPDSVRAVATLVSSSGQIYYAGLTKGKGSILVRDPLYWWPKGLGVQNLYRLTVNLYGESDIEDTAEIRIGLRTVLPPYDGESFMMVNGTKFLPMGATYFGEEDPDFTTADDKLEKLITSASMANYNCLVVRENSPRLSEKFWELCDIHGILVIEEHDSLDENRIEAIERYCYHPSLCLVDAIGIGDKESARELAKSRIPSVAISFINEAEDYVTSPSLPSMKTIRTAIPENERSLFSKSVEALTNREDMHKMLISVANRYPYPHDLNAFSYASALASANIVCKVIRGSRISMGGSGRAVFDRLGDPNIMVSGSAIDVKSRWKPLQYYVRRNFAPIKVYADIDDGKIIFSASNMRKLDFIGTLEYRIADAANYTIYKSSEPCEISAVSSTRISTRDLSQYIKGHEEEYYLEYFLKEGSVTISKSTLLFVPEKHFAFKKPKIKSVINGEGRQFSITLSADAFVKDLEIGFDGIDVVLEDNYIDFTSEAPVKINFTVSGGYETTHHLKDSLELFSVCDLK